MFALLLALVSMPDDAAVRAAAAQDVRVATIGYRLARAGAGTADLALCDGLVSLPGLVIQDITQYAAADHDAARRVLGIGDGPTVVAVVPHSAGERAGLLPGDRIISVNGTAIDAPVSRFPYARMAQFEGLIENAIGSERATMNVRRRGSEVRVDMEREAGCPSWFQIVSRRPINAQADGRYVQIFSGMMDFAANDDELATIMAHELAHNVQRHIARKTPSKQAEYEADRLGVWLMARAGYDVDAVVPFWTRFEKRTNAGIFADGTHPSPKKRIAAVAKAVSEVKVQRAAGQALVPPTSTAAQ